VTCECEVCAANSRLGGGWKMSRQDSCGPRQRRHATVRKGPRQTPRRWGLNARPACEDPAELVAQVSARKRDVLLRVHLHRLGREDLEDCFSQATLELITRARSSARTMRPTRSNSASSPWPVSRTRPPMSLSAWPTRRTSAGCASSPTSSRPTSGSCSPARWRWTWTARSPARASGGRRRGFARSPSSPARGCACSSPTTRPGSAAGAWRMTSPPASPTWLTQSSQSACAAISPTARRARAPRASSSASRAAWARYCPCRPRSTQ
jgi:hypothetical protein